MKKLVLVCTVFLMAASTSSAFDYLGPPTNDMQQGQWGAGFGYSYSNMDIDVKGDRYFDHYGISGKLPKRIRMHKYYGTVNYGVSNDTGVYGLVGAASAKTDLSVGGAPYAHREMNFGHAPVWGFGVKHTFYRSGAFQGGAMIQCSWVRDFSASRHIYSFQYAKANIDLMETHIVVGGTYRVRPSWYVYGGPVLHLIRGDFRGKGLCSYCGITDDVTHDIQQSAWFGGYVGTYIRFNNGTYISVEYIHTAHGDGIGTGFVIPI